MDISFKTQQGRFNYRACAVILSGDRILAMKDGRSPYFYLPGGRVRLHETLEEAVLREVREELDVQARIVRPLWLNQGFFSEDVSGERYHELCLYFLVDVSETDIPARGESFPGREAGQAFTWLKFEALKDEYFYPLFLKEQIFELPRELTLTVNREE